MSDPYQCSHCPGGGLIGTDAHDDDCPWRHLDADSGASTGALSDEQRSGEPVSPSSSEWNAWATFANHVTEALGELHQRPLFSQRRAAAEALWQMGYRPTVEQIAAEVQRQSEPRHVH